MQLCEACPTLVLPRFTPAVAPTAPADVDVIGDILEGDFDGHADSDGLRVAVDDVGHHAGALGQLDDGEDEWRFASKTRMRRSIVDGE